MQLKMLNKIPSITQFYHNQIKVNYEQRKSPNFRMVRHIENILLFYLIFRLLNASFIGQFVDSTSFLMKYDELAHFIYSRSTQNKVYHIFAVVGILQFVGFAQKAIYYSGIDCLTWFKHYELIVVNYQVYQKCIKSPMYIDRLMERKVNQIKEKSSKIKLLKIIPYFIRNNIFSVIAKVEMIRKMENLNLCKFSQHKMTVFPNLSPKLRVKIILLQLFFEKVSSVILTLLC